MGGSVWLQKRPGGRGGEICEIQDYECRFGSEIEDWEGSSGELIPVVLRQFIQLQIFLPV